jgi:hypothetical protein
VVHALMVSVLQGPSLDSAPLQTPLLHSVTACNRDKLFVTDLRLTTVTQLEQALYLRAWV